MNKRILAYYATGFLVCAGSLLLRFLWLQGETAVPRMIQNVIFGLPWISVAVVLVLWRSRELPHKYPLAYVFGTVTPLIFATIWLALQ